jgi:hypothetical protein
MGERGTKPRSGVAGKPNVGSQLQRPAISHVRNPVKCWPTLLWHVCNPKPLHTEFILDMYKYIIDVVRLLC